MKANGLTHWGGFLVYLRGVSIGLLLSHSLSQVSNTLPVWLAVGGLFVSGFLTPLLRLLGWRKLVERTGDIKPNPLPRPREVERALRALLADGRSLQGAVRILHETFGWDVMELSPAVATVADLPQKEAIRLVVSLTVLAESEAGR